MSDPRVDHPAHYGGADNPYETIKVVEAWGLGFALGNAVKYISRAGRKDADPLVDLRKARWYLDREIARLEGPADPEGEASADPFDPFESSVPSGPAPPSAGLVGGSEPLGDGYTLSWEPNSAGGRTYISDEVGGGVMAWDTCCVRRDTLLAALAVEARLRNRERTRWPTRPAVSAPVAGGLER